jgi:hypothetical protein
MEVREANGMGCEPQSLPEWRRAEIIILEIERASVGSRKRARGLGRGWAG